MSKKQIRINFRNSVYERDNYSCVTCGLVADKTNPQEVLDAHHIIDRNQIENGGYVKENGISLCKVKKNCHLKAEEFHSTGVAIPGFSPEELFIKIKSSEKIAREAASKL